VWFLETEKLQRRHIAYKLRIKDILNSKYVKTEGVNPNYLEVNGHGISRLNVIGVIIEKSYMGSYSTLTIEDGTEKIAARSFENNLFLDKVDVGDVVIIIGRPRKYLEEMYVLIEIIRKINPLWARVRKLELNYFNLDDKNHVEEKYTKDVFDENSKNKILKVIKELDKGEGVSIEDIPSNGGDIDNIVDVLLREGDVFEVRPGKLKVLE